MQHNMGRQVLFKVIQSDDDFKLVTTGDQHCFPFVLTHLGWYCWNLYSEFD
jgi:hypothetical protein